MCVKECVSPLRAAASTSLSLSERGRPTVQHTRTHRDLGFRDRTRGGEEATNSEAKSSVTGSKLRRNGI